MEARLVLDSGLFLPASPGCVEIGFFQNQQRSPDIRLYVDGEEASLASSPKLATSGRLIEVLLRKSDGTPLLSPMIRAATLSKQLTRLNDLYESSIAVDRSRFDWILRLYSGHLRGSTIKKRVFLEAKRAADGTFVATGRSKHYGEICHNIVASFELEGDDQLELVSDGRIILSSGRLGFTKTFQVEFPSDDSAGEKLYSRPLVVQRQLYWFPDGCDEGPSGPYPPCQIL